ncbi:MAG TPA: arylsulfotransferase family protein [Thermoleophilaceae bacterium]|nr:arylsulfotransferase family protein [Thermoleophilaceae bacterium]
MRGRVSPRLTSLLAAAALVAAVTSFSGPSQAAHPPVAVFPAADTLVASPDSQISFRGATPAELTGIKVRGSVSGTHGGTLRPHSDGQGASFVPEKGFKRGEHVRVYADLPLVGQAHGYVRFRISRPPGKWTLGAGREPGGSAEGEQHFETLPDLRPPSIVVNKREQRARGLGNLFVASKAGPGQDGPMIADERGRLIWFHKNPKRRSAFDFRTQTYRGKPVLTWWQGRARPGQGKGENLIYDSSYRKIATVRAGNGYAADLHEFEISPNDTALVLVYEPVTFGGTTAMDTIVQEIDIPTGLVMYEFHALGNISSKESHGPHDKGHPYDVAHLNSIQMTPDGNLLVSARHTNTVYKLSRRTARILWRLGGKRSDFKMVGNSDFISQHHARLQPDGSITLFDNGGPPDPGRESRALWLNVDEQKRRVSVRKAYKYRRSLKAFSAGSTQVLPNGDVFVGWGGSVPYFAQYTAKGSAVYDAHFKPKGDETYRAYRFPWHGQPVHAPDVAARAADGKTDVFASWNGATEVARWQVRAGSSKSTLAPVATVARDGFETKATIGGTPAFVQVRALDASGTPLGTSRAVKPE